MDVVIITVGITCVICMLAFSLYETKQQRTSWSARQRVVERDLDDQRFRDIYQKLDYLGQDVESLFPTRPLRRQGRSMRPFGRRTGINKAWALRDRRTT